MSQNNFSIAAVIRSCIADTWGKVRSDEHREHQRLVERFGACSRIFSAKLPDHALRDMTATGVSGSNYLVASDHAGYLPALQPASVCLKLGAQTINAGPGYLLLPTGNAVITTQWLSDENAAITESQPTIGQIASTPKILAALCEITHQMLKQTNAEEIVRKELRRAAGAALDAAAIQGTGTLGQPQGIIGTTNVGAFTGTSLNRSALTNAQLDVSTANAIVNGSIGYATTPAIANTLANRADTIESTKALWQGPLHDGQLLGVRGLATTNVPSATAVYGDWSNLSFVSWGVAEIAVDPITKFNYGSALVRLMLMVDIVPTRPAGFSVATSIT